MFSLTIISKRLSVPQAILLADRRNLVHYLLGCSHEHFGSCWRFHSVTQTVLSQHPSEIRTTAYRIHLASADAVDASSSQKRSYCNAKGYSTSRSQRSKPGWARCATCIVATWCRQLPSFPWMTMRIGFDARHPPRFLGINCIERSDGNPGQNPAAGHQFWLSSAGLAGEIQQVTAQF